MASLLDTQGRRKYLLPAERERFMKAALACDKSSSKALCLTLLYTGCRVSEALNLKPSDIDTEERTITIRTLKQRDKKSGSNTFRVMPVPDSLITVLNSMPAQKSKGERLWPIARSTAWRQVKDVMRKAEIAGVHASPKGLRHGFAIAAVYKGVPVTLISRFMGHKNLQTTMIYLDFVGAQEREMVSLTWPKSKE